MSTNYVRFNFVLVIFLQFFCQFSTIGFECGRSKHSQGFIIGGKFVNRGDYPWLAALVNLNTQSFFCGGTLITNIHVVTAAHCISTKGTQKTLLPKDVAVFLGRHNLNFTIERGALALYLDQIYVHPDWRWHTDDYDADIAILRFQNRAKFSEYIFPICWPSRQDIEPVFKGTVIGWGKSEDETKIHENIPKQLEVESIHNEACFLDYYVFAIISSKRTFCAGVENAGPCIGDSGGGLFVKKNSNWMIRGIVSSSLVEKGSCDVTRYAIYTSVIMYTDWAREVLNQTKSIQANLNEIMEPPNAEDSKHHITIDCNYGISRNGHAVPPKSLYACFVVKSDVPQRNSITHIYGKHNEGKSNPDVVEFKYELNNEFPYIPMDIGKIFPNLELFFVGQSSLNYIERKNFEGMSKVTSLFLGFNQLEELPKDGFYELFSLRALFIDNNRIKGLHRDLLIKMPKLEKFVAHNNEIEYLDAGIFRQNLLLNLINLLNNKLKTIGVNFEQLPDIQYIDLRQNTCINEEFKEGITIGEFQDLIIKNCNY